MKTLKNKNKSYIKALKKANRELQEEIFGFGFKAITNIFKSKKTHTRKNKHKSNLDD